MRVLVVVNPSAGRNSQSAVERALDRHLRAAGAVYVLHTTRPGADLAKEIRQRLTEGFDVVLAAGGDGTVSSVVDGLMGSEIPLGIIPVGTGNLVARELNIPTSVDAAVALMVGQPQSVKVDVMRINGRAYVLNAGVGLSAAVVRDISRAQKRRLGFVAYVVTTLVKLISVRPRRLTVVVDGTHHAYRAVEIMVNNCGILARRLYPKPPDIRMDDGRLNVWVMSTQALFDYPRYLFATVVGRKPRLEAQFLHAERTVSISAKVPLPVQADGDVIGTTPVEIALVPSAVTVLAPAGDPDDASRRRALNALGTK